MKIQSYFNPARFWLVLKRDTAVNYKRILVIVFGLIGLHFFFMLFNATTDNPNNIADKNGDITSYAIYLLGSGLLISGFAFPEIRNRLKNYRYLTLPASSLEKFVSYLLLTTVGYISLFTISYWGFSHVFLSIIESILDTENLNVFELTNPLLWNVIQAYIIIQSLFLAGALSFRRLPPLSALAVFFLAILGLFLVGKFYAWMIFGDHISGNLANIAPFKWFPGYQFKESEIADNIPMGIFTGIWYVATLFFWLIGFLKLKEKEV